MLNDYYKPDGPERIGVILHDDTTIELDNIYPEPEAGASISASDLFKYECEAKAFWHTHPNRLAIPSTEDLTAFKNYPIHLHYIVGSDGVKCFVVINGDVQPCG